MLVTLYKRPNGYTKEIDMQNICTEDAEWFESNNIKVSLENCGFSFIVYADCGFHIADDPEEGKDEIMVTAEGRPCKEVMKRLRRYCTAVIKIRPRFPLNSS